MLAMPLFSTPQCKCYVGRPARAAVGTTIRKVEYGAVVNERAVDDDNSVMPETGLSHT